MDIHNLIQYGTIASAVLAFWKLWNFSKARDKSLADKAAADAIWRNDVEHKMETIAALKQVDDKIFLEL